MLTTLDLIALLAGAAALVAMWGASLQWAHHRGRRAAANDVFVSAVGLGADTSGAVISAWLAASRVAANGLKD